jgi:hypothetical protein
MGRKNPPCPFFRNCRCARSDSAPKVRVDPKAREIPLTPRQHFFASCWFNMVHQHSLDSHRVRTMNARNVLRELLRMYEATHANDEDRTLVREEAIVILSGDPVVRSAAARLSGALLDILRAESKRSPVATPFCSTYPGSFSNSSSLLTSTMLSTCCDRCSCRLLAVRAGTGMKISCPR